MQCCGSVDPAPDLRFRAYGPMGRIRILLFLFVTFKTPKKLRHFFKIESHEDVTKTVGIKGFLTIFSWWSWGILIKEAKKHTDPDPQHWFHGSAFLSLFSDWSLILLCSVEGKLHESVFLLVVAVVAHFFVSLFVCSFSVLHPDQIGSGTFWQGRIRIRNNHCGTSLLQNVLSLILRRITYYLVIFTVAHCTVLIVKKLILRLKFTWLPFFQFFVLGPD